tara:strand:+ start:354 stop:1328 length:975 start_codon:yes stop_codon:yes gene_type:complete
MGDTVICRNLIAGDAEDEASNANYEEQLLLNDTTNEHLIVIVKELMEKRNIKVDLTAGYYLIINLYSLDSIKTVNDLYDYGKMYRVDPYKIILQINDKKIISCNYFEKEITEPVLKDICNLLCSPNLIYKQNNYKDIGTGRGINRLEGFKSIYVDNKYIITSIILCNNYTYDIFKKVNEYINMHNKKISEYNAKIAQEKHLINKYLYDWQNLFNHGLKEEEEKSYEEKYKDYEQIKEKKKREEEYLQISRKQFENEFDERQGGCKKLPKKEILGKIICIYKIPGDRKEYVRHKGKLITVKDYKELMKAKKPTKLNKPSKPTKKK